MSRFDVKEFPCPECDQSVEFGVVASINADRRPDLRDAILDGSFQRGSCDHCGNNFRIDPEFAFLDVGRRQWILVLPGSEKMRWNHLESNAKFAFEISFGENAGGVAHELGKTMHSRVAFGWPAIREKLLCAEYGLDDVILEQLKLMLIKGLDNAMVGTDVELRLNGVEDSHLKLHWISAVDASPLEFLEIPRNLYDEIAADKEGWKELREQLTAGTFVDVDRLLIEAATIEDVKETDAPQN